MTDLIRSESTSPPLPLSHIQYSCIDIDTPQSLLVTATWNHISPSSLQRCTESHLGPGHQSDMRNNFPLFTSALMSWNENCQEVRNLIKVIMILAGFSHLPPQAREASPSSSPGYSQDTRDFIQVTNSQQSPSTAEKGTSSQYWAIKDLTHCYNRSATFHYFQNIILAISHSIISVKCNVWFSKLITNEINEYSWVYWVSIMIRNNLLFWWFALKWPYWPSRRGGHNRWEWSWSLGLSWVLGVGLMSPVLIILRQWSSEHCSFCRFKKEWWRKP